MDDTLTSLLANMVNMVDRLNQLDDLRGEQIKQLRSEVDAIKLEMRVNAAVEVLSDD